MGKTEEERRLIGTRIRDLIEEYKSLGSDLPHTQEELAALLNMDKGNFSAMLQGKRGALEEYAAPISEVLKVSEKYLTLESDDREGTEKAGDFDAWRKAYYTRKAVSILSGVEVKSMSDFEPDGTAALVCLSCQGKEYICPSESYIRFCDEIEKYVAMRSEAFLASLDDYNDSDRREKKLQLLHKMSDPR